MNHVRHRNPEDSVRHQCFQERLCQATQCKKVKYDIARVSRAELVKIESCNLPSLLRVSFSVTVLPDILMLSHLAELAGLVRFAAENVVLTQS